MLRERLLSLDDGMGVVPSEYAMALIPFRDVIAKHGPVEGAKWLTYVYQMKDSRSFFNGYTEKQKHVQVLEDLFGAVVEPDRTVLRALEYYNEHESSTMKLLRSARESVNNLQQWLQDVDPKDDDYDPIKHVKILESMGRTVDSLKKLEAAAEKESDENSTYGNVELNEFSR